MENKSINTIAILSVLVSLFILALSYYFTKINPSGGFLDDPMLSHGITGAFLLIVGSILFLISAIALFSPLIKEKSSLNKKISSLIIIGVVLNAPLIIMLFVGASLDSMLFHSSFGLASLFGFILIILGIIKD
ncbi:MAG: hypothetical protein WC745_05625 [Patescibacteria group bacterium]|jgi:hypothetical protein